MKRSLLTLLLLSFCISRAQKPVPLRDGQQVTLHGTLTMEPAGRLQFATIKTPESYIPVFREGGGKEAPGETLHEISLAGYADYALLYAHRGQQVSVTGKLTTDEASPYFWHGTRLQVAGIRTSGGADLLGKTRNLRLAADTGLYRSAVLLPADLAAPWRYKFEGKSTQERYLLCSSNGGGDVVNCSCAEGFHPIEASTSPATGRNQAQILKDMHTAQFGVGDDAQAVELAVTCSR